MGWLPKWNQVLNRKQEAYLQPVRLGSWSPLTCHWRWTWNSTQEPYWTPGKIQILISANQEWQDSSLLALDSPMFTDCAAIRQNKSYGYGQGLGARRLFLAWSWLFVNVRHSGTAIASITKHNEKRRGGECSKWTLLVRLKAGVGEEGGFRLLLTTIALMSSTLLGQARRRDLKLAKHATLSWYALFVVTSINIVAKGRRVIHLSLLPPIIFSAVKQVNCGH